MTTTEPEAEAEVIPGVAVTLNGQEIQANKGEPVSYTHLTLPTKA